jgi:uncharacterized membrane protein YphA (DoxX/SURF4 family)
MTMSPPSTVVVRPDAHRLVWRVGFGVVRVLLGLVLLAAGLSKIHQLVSDPAALLSGSRWLMLAVVQVELILSAWLLSGLFPDALRRVALATFAVLALISGRRVFAGDSSCGCFGRFSPQPSYTLALNLSAVVLLSVLRPSRGSVHGRRDSIGRLVLVCLVPALVGGLVAVAVARLGPARLESDGRLSNAPVVVVDPREWTGRRLPLLAHIDVGERLQSGEWIVLLHQHECPKCREVLPEYESLAASLGPRPGGARVALVEVPPYAADAGEAAAPESRCTRGRLSDDREWFVRTPTEIRLRDGVVSAVRSL